VPVILNATDRDRTDVVGDGTIVPMAHSYRNQRATAANPTMDHPNGVDVKQPIGPHARGSFWLARRAPTTGTTAALDDVEGVRRAECNPQLWGAWAFRNRPLGSLLGGPLDGSCRSAVSGTGVNYGRRPRPAKRACLAAEPSHRAGGARTRRPTAPCRRAPGARHEGSSKVVGPKFASRSLAHPAVRVAERPGVGSPAPTPGRAFAQA